MEVPISNPRNNLSSISALHTILIFSSDVLKTDSRVLYYIVYDQSVLITKRFQVLQHLNTNKHKKHNNLLE